MEVIPFIIGKDKYQMESTDDSFDPIDRTSENVFFLLNVLILLLIIDLVYYFINWLIFVTLNLTSYIYMHAIVLFSKKGP